MKCLVLLVSAVVGFWTSSWSGWYVVTGARRGHVAASAASQREPHPRTHRANGIHVKQPLFTIATSQLPHFLNYPINHSVQVTTHNKHKFAVQQLPRSRKFKTVSVNLFHFTSHLFFVHHHIFIQWAIDKFDVIFIM